MRPVLFTLLGLPISSYAVFLLAGLAAATWIRRAEVARLGYPTERHRWVGLGALLGAAVGAKLGMALFVPPGQLWELLGQATRLEFEGKTVVGGLAGGYAGVELVKRLIGVRTSTGDAFALAVPVGQALGRLGCFFHGCCYGAPWDGPWAVELGGARRHPAQLYEALLDLALAAALYAIRGRPRPAGHLFRYFLLGYAAIRITLEPLRGDAGLQLGPFTAVQLFCAAAAGLLLWSIARDRRALRAPAVPA